MTLQALELKIELLLKANKISPDIVWHVFDPFRKMGFSKDNRTGDMVVVTVIGDVITIWKETKEIKL